VLQQLIEAVLWTPLYFWWARRQSSPDYDPRKHGCIGVYTPTWDPQPSTPPEYTDEHPRRSVGLQERKRLLERLMYLTTPSAKQS
jgi:hypothetical protein